MIKIADSSNVIQASDKLVLVEAAKSWPFDVWILIDSNQAVNIKDSFVIEINSATNEVSVYFGNNLNIPKSAWQNITKAGNSDFSEGRLVDGIKKIVTKAHESRVSAEIIQNENHDHGLIYTHGVIGLVCMIIIVLGIRSFLRDRKRRINTTQNL